MSSDSQGHRNRAFGQPIFSHRALAVTPSYYCDAHCRHCFLPRRLRRQDLCDESLMRKTLANVPPGVRIVSITGGEPFARPQRLLGLLRAAAESRTAVTAVTNGLWSRDWPRAKRLLGAVRDEGLFGLSISVDRYHRPRLRTREVVRLVQSARAVGLCVNIKGAGTGARALVDRIWQTAGTAPADRLEDLFDLENIGEAERLPEDRLEAGVKTGCLGAMEPGIEPDGKVYACCSVRILEVRNRVLALGDLHVESLGTILDRASRDYLLAGLVLEGPRFVGRLLGREVASGCEECIRLLNQEKLVRAVRRRISTDRELRKELVGKHLLLAQLYLAKRFPWL